LAQNTSSVTVVGHSLGAALALLDGLSLRLRLDSSVNVRVIGYGMPRVGDQDFADLVDTRLDGQVTHVNNQEDPVPIIPGKFLGFHHVLGEIHINDSGDWKKCPGAFLTPPSPHSPSAIFPLFFQGADLGLYIVHVQVRTILPLSAAKAMWGLSSQET
jgi:hypothetical protein